MRLQCESKKKKSEARIDTALGVRALSLSLSLSQTRAPVFRTRWGLCRESRRFPGTARSRVPVRVMRFALWFKVSCVSSLRFGPRTVPTFEARSKGSRKTLSSCPRTLAWFCHCQDRKFVHRWKSCGIVAPLQHELELARDVAALLGRGVRLNVCLFVLGEEKKHLKNSVLFPMSLVPFILSVSALEPRLSRTFGQFDRSLTRDSVSRQSASNVTTPSRTGVIDPFRTLASAPSEGATRAGAGGRSRARRAGWPAPPTTLLDLKFRSRLVQLGRFQYIRCGTMESSRETRDPFRS